MKLKLETGNAPMPWSQPVKRVSDSELAGLRAQLMDLVDRGWILHSTAGHAAAVFARKPDGSWRICYDYRGLNFITRPAIEQLSHINTPLDGTRGSFLPKLDLATTSCGCGPRTGGRRSFGRNWATSSERSAVWSVGRPPRCSHAS